MTLLRCPKFLRCLTADAGNFDRGHSLTSLLLPLAALSSLPTSARPTALLVTLRRGGRLCPPVGLVLYPRQGTRALPYKMLGRRAGPMCPAAHRTPCKTPVIAKPVRTLAVAIRIPRPQAPQNAKKQGPRRDLATKIFSFYQTLKPSPAPPPQMPRRSAWPPGFSPSAHPAPSPGARPR